MVAIDVFLWGSRKSYQNTMPDRESDRRRSCSGTDAPAAENGAEIRTIDDPIAVDVGRTRPGTTAPGTENDREVCSIDTTVAIEIRRARRAGEFEPVQVEGRIAAVLEPHQLGSGFQ